MRKIADILLRAVLTGFAIAIGGTVYLSCGNKFLGAFLFGTGLFVILSFGFNLFTGKVGYAVEREAAYLGELGLIWLGNLAGAVLAALDGDMPVLGVLQKADTAFLRAVASHPCVRVVTVMEENRDRLRQELHL